MTGPVDVLAIAAHPDDVEIGCGGTLILAGDTGARTAVADLTRGEFATNGTPEQRAQESETAAKVLGLADRRVVGLPDGRLGADPAHRTAVVALIRQVRPRIVLAPYPEDRHPDHAAAGRLAREACFFAGVASSDAGEPHRPERLYHYMVHHPFTPSFVVDVTDVWERRREALEAHESQLGVPGTEIGTAGFVAYLEARAVFYGAMIGVTRGEPFSYPGPLPMRGLPALQRREDPPTYSVFR